MRRGSHLVGTIPAADTRAAMQLALTEQGATLDMLPDGETGRRLDWIQKIVDDLAQNPDVEQSKQGTWSEYDDIPRYKVKRGHKLTADTLDFGYAASFRESYPVYRELIGDRGAEVPFQVGIPGDFDLSLFAFGPLGYRKARRAFLDATVREITAIQAASEGDVVFQLEVPAELIFVARMRGPLQGVMARYLAGKINAAAAGSPAGARFGIHLCLGDMNHRSLVGMRDVRPVVLLANAIAKRWPEGRSLEFMHAPFAAAVEPPSTDPRWYEPLKKLGLPESTRFIPGFAHDRQALADQREVQATIERALGAPCDVSASCGLGRRELDDAIAVMRRTAELAAD